MYTVNSRYVIHGVNIFFIITPEVVQVLTLNHFLTKNHNKRVKKFKCIFMG